MLGDRLRRARERKGLTQDVVAKHLGVARPTYTQYESNRRQPDLETLTRLAELYEVSLDILLGAQTPPSDKIEPEVEAFAEWVKEKVGPSFFYDFDDSPEESREQLLADLKYLWEREKKQREREKNKKKEE